MALALTRKQLAKRYDPPADYGFFGPDSVTWKVWSYPTSFILGFVRSVTIEHLDPNLAAAVIQSGGVKYRPYTRYTRTLRYFGMVMFGATEPTAKAADVLVKIHSKAIGNDPVNDSGWPLGAGRIVGQVQFAYAPGSHQVRGNLGGLSVGMGYQLPLFGGAGR